MKNTMNRVLAAGLSMTMLIPSIVPAMAKEVESARNDNQSTQVKYEVGSHYKWTIHSAIDFGADAGPNSSVSRDGNQDKVLENVIPERKYLNISVKGDGTDGAFTLTNGKTEKLNYDVTDDAGDVAVNGNVLSVPSGTNTAVQNMNFKLNTKKATAEIAGNYDGKVIYNAELGGKDGVNQREKSSTIIGSVWDGKNAPDTQFANAIPEQATAVAFTNEVVPKGVATTDLTVAKDNGVVGWLDGTTWKVSTQNPNKAVAFNENCMGMFRSKTSLTSISFDNIDTSNEINMGAMFYGCTNLISLDLSNFDTSNVTNMMSMFDTCPNLTQLDISSFNTSYVTDMSQMFFRCKNISNIYVGNGWSTKKVVGSTISGHAFAAGYIMFGECINLPNYDSSILGENQLQKAHTGPNGYLTLKQ